jgi:hypothetical protein
MKKFSLAAVALGLFALGASANGGFAVQSSFGFNAVDPCVQPAFTTFAVQPAPIPLFPPAVIFSRPAFAGFRVGTPFVGVGFFGPRVFIGGRAFVGGRSFVGGRGREVVRTRQVVRRR